MSNYPGSVDTDMAIGTILSNFETPWIMHTIQDSLEMRFRPFADPMPNFVDILNRQFEQLKVEGPDYVEKIDSVKYETYREIIDTICQYYNLSFTEPFEQINPAELYGIARTIYEVFISRFTDYTIDFFIRYIINNSDSIYAYLVADDNVKKPKEKDAMARSYIDPKFQLIHANVNKVILNMAAYDIPLDTLLGYFLDPNSAVRLSQCLVDKGDIFRNYYAIYLLDNRYMAQLLTAIKLRLQAQTQQSFSVNNDAPQVPEETSIEGNI